LTLGIGHARLRAGLGLLQPARREFLEEGSKALIALTLSP